jgi:predicted dehydrogenase
MMRAAVIGVGAMGHHHARVYNEMPTIGLVGLSDLNLSLAQELAQRYNANAYADYKVMLEETRPHLVTVSVPTQVHCQVTLDALEAGSHVLVEKPIATTVREGQRMIDRAAELERVLAVGHIERFNPAVIELKRRLEAGEAGQIFQIHARRVGPFPARVRDVGVVVDLAPHDLDIMRYLTGSEARRLYAETERQIHTAHEDLFSGMVRFESGVLGVLDINWLTPTKIRQISVVGQRGMFVANLLTQDLYFYENDLADGLSWSSLSLLRGVSEGQMVRLKLHKREPLLVELEAFITAAGGGEAQIVTGQDGLVALELALKLVKAACENRVIHWGQPKRTGESED